MVGFIGEKIFVLSLQLTSVLSAEVGPVVVLALTCSDGLLMLSVGLRRYIGYTPWQLNLGFDRKTGLTLALPVCKLLLADFDGLAFRLLECLECEDAR